MEYVEYTESVLLTISDMIIETPNYKRALMAVAVKTLFYYILIIAASIHIASLVPSLLAGLIAITVTSVSVFFPAYAVDIISKKANTLADIVRDTPGYTDNDPQHLAIINRIKTGAKITSNITIILSYVLFYFLGGCDLFQYFDEDFAED